jgi:hypothetical protein
VGDTVRRDTILVLGVVTLWAALAVVGGWPDPRASLDLLTGTRVDTTTETALVTLLCWLAVVLLTLTLARSIRPARRASTSRAGRWPAAVLLVGAALLAAGLAHQGGYRVCCATPATAHQADQLVH